MLFSFHTAWFSTSCPEAIVELWKKHDGVLVPVDCADFVFSDDADHDDTAPLFETEDYKTDQLTVFRSSWVRRAVNAASNADACQLLDQYVLTPPRSDHSTPPEVAAAARSKAARGKTRQTQQAQSQQQTQQQTQQQPQQQQAQQQQAQQQQAQQQQQGQDWAEAPATWAALGRTWSTLDHDVSSFEHVRRVLSVDANTMIDEFTPGKAPWRVVKAGHA
ncbi:hypothetical protein PTSG_06632 [Salpingoeca rosetta]|uniref:Uncharacterized protein n=1 Tax=Salpingoeca rosetta (strain ATCC 50818 / BSB-021) TaxID=946362 RepID=F2UFJ4_SALR5|nr:uncharacterized protein PTSG_06632 [Salpingoeca rosetta]EGD75562.1 hypothetical protein PTSG_06632 [Salpingoeca rosetta]|eukprot:XP_004992019.1 hypothetical protein PTSG_06632 [Salpingoeca rosetta]